MNPANWALSTKNREISHKGGNAWWWMQSPSNPSLLTGKLTGKDEEGGYKHISISMLWQSVSEMAGSARPLLGSSVGNNMALLSFGRHDRGIIESRRSKLRPHALGPNGATLPIRLSPTATSGSVRPCSWTFTSVAIFGSHNRSQSSSDFFPTTRPAPPTWRRLAGATGLFAPIVRRRESRSASQIVLASCAAASAAVTPD